MHFGAENLGNILLFLPFGALYPIFNEHASWKRTLFAGMVVSAAIELLQPVFGRSFDINDVILNGVGIGVSTIIYFSLKRILWHKP